MQELQFQEEHIIAIEREGKSNGREAIFEERRAKNVSKLRGKKKVTDSKSAINLKD